MNKELMIKSEQDKTIELLCQVLELSDTSEVVVKKSVKELGVIDFFNHFDELEIEDIEKERIFALKKVIEKKEQEILAKEGERPYGN